jgi:hypothetical protein
MAALHPDLWVAICAHGAVSELHAWRTMPGTIKMAATRALQRRFPNLPWTHILKHTHNVLTDLYQSHTIEIHGDYIGPCWQIIRYVDTTLPQTVHANGLANTTMQLFSLQHECSLDIFYEYDTCVITDTADKNWLMFIVETQQREFYVTIWGFHAKIQTHTIQLSESIYHRLRPNERRMSVSVAPNHQAVWISNVDQTPDNILNGCVVQYNGVIVNLVVAMGTVTWKENELYVDDKLIYTLT